MEFNHISVLLEEAVAGLNIKPDGIYVDCTLGGGGHSRKILESLNNGMLYCFDQDKQAIESAKSKLEETGKNFKIINSNFRNIKSELKKLGVTKVDGILFDLGVSSPQFDHGNRGFSYNYDGRLDMRMNQEQELDAYQIINTYSFEELVKILFRYGDEKFAKQIARKIEEERKKQPIETTFQLVDLIKSALPAAIKRKIGHPAKKSFQAIRIAVNDELGALEDALTDSLELLDSKGRISVITFQSLEDKLVKHIFSEVSNLPKLPRNMPFIPLELQPKYRIINKKPIVASEKELSINKRAHSAKLRIIERLEDEKN